MDITVCLIILKAVIHSRYQINRLERFLSSDVFPGFGAFVNGYDSKVGLSAFKWKSCISIIHFSGLEKWVQGKLFLEGLQDELQRHIYKGKFALDGTG